MPIYAWIIVARINVMESLGRRNLDVISTSSCLIILKSVLCLQISSRGCEEVHTPVATWGHETISAWALTAHSKLENYQHQNKFKQMQLEGECRNLLIFSSDNRLIVLLYSWYSWPSVHPPVACDAFFDTFLLARGDAFRPDLAEGQGDLSLGIWCSATFRPKFKNWLRIYCLHNDNIKCWNTKITDP